QGIAEHRILSLDVEAFQGSALTDDIDVPKDREESEMADVPVTYVPARNLVMLSMALAIAETIGASDLFVGVNAIDYSGYPDCRPAFIRSFEATATLATRAGTEGGAFRVHAPLIESTKAEIIRQGVDLGVDYALTHSCYDPGVDGHACGRCDSCILRRRGFEQAGIDDPTVYV
ncbi:MAG: 7-cyano-7-deazaguanine synthase, partial [Phycisphaerales bacterium]|nr:7-cyano-7-deazaguanine synthase [Phycisphaerales bacterium]